MNESTTTPTEEGRLPPAVLLIIGILAGLVVTALIFFFLAYKLKSCKDQPRTGERKSSIVPDKIEALTPKLKLGRSGTVESLAVSEKWRSGYGSRRESEDILATCGVDLNAASRSPTATNTSETPSNDVILRVISEHENKDHKSKSEREATFDLGYPSKPIHSNPSIA